jgi:hypothetical protein
MQANDLNVKAKAFVPEYAKEEEYYFNKLEKEFVKTNKWIFEEEEMENNDKNSKMKTTKNNIDKLWRY